MVDGATFKYVLSLDSELSDCTLYPKAAELLLKAFGSLTSTTADFNF